VTWAIWALFLSCLLLALSISALAFVVFQLAESIVTAVTESSIAANSAQAEVAKAVNDACGRICGCFPWGK